MFFLDKKESNWCQNNFLNYKSLLRVDKLRTQLSKIIDSSNLIKCHTDNNEIEKNCSYSSIISTILSGFFIQV